MNDLLWKRVVVSLILKITDITKNKEVVFPQMIIFLLLVEEEGHWTEYHYPFKLVCSIKIPFIWEVSLLCSPHLLSQNSKPYLARLFWRLEII